MCVSVTSGRISNFPGLQFARNPFHGTAVGKRRPTRLELLGGVATLLSHCDMDRSGYSFPLYLVLGTTGDEMLAYFRSRQAVGGP